MYGDLEKCCRKHGSTKFTHKFKDKNYLDVYEMYFNKLRNKPINFLEIGIKGGGSLKMWKDYFPRAKIFALDIDPGCKKYEEDRISVYIGDQTDEKVLSKICKNAGNFHIIVDDGSHVNRFTIKSFEYLFPYLKPNGIYCIEDMKPTYKKLETNYGVREKWPGMKYNDPDVSLDNDRKEMMDFFEDKLKDLDHQQGEIMSIQFWSMMCFILKCK